MDNILFDIFLTSFINGLIHPTSETLMLTLHTDEYVPDRTMTVYDPITTHEIEHNNGYSRGGKSVTNIAMTSSQEEFAFTANNVVWLGATFSARYAILWCLADETYVPIACYDFGETVTGDGSRFAIEWPAGVLMTISTEMLSLTAYDLWLEAGYTGTIEDFMQFLVGPQGIQGVQGISVHNLLSGLEGGTYPNYYHSDQAINIASSPAFAGLTVSGLTASRAIVTGAGGIIQASSVTSTEVQHLSGVTSGIQGQINEIASRHTSTPFTLQTSVNVTHNFGAYPIVQVMNESGDLITPQGIRHNTINDFTVTFGIASSGTIVSSL